MSVMLYSNEAVKALIKSLIMKNREPHSIAICGDKGQGKKAMARYIGASLLCEDNTGEPCGKCKSCRMIAGGVHPDFITVKPNENGNYQVDTIREIVSDAVTKPNEGKFKIYLIPDLDRSANTAVQVQNILLKLIEEPPEHCIIILTAISKEIFLDTVISRVLCLRTTPCKPKDSTAFLERFGKYTNEEIANAVAFGGGNIGRCVDYLEDPTFAQATEIAKASINAIYEHDEYGLLKAFFLADGKKALMRQVLLAMEEAFRDACVLRSGSKSVVGFFKTESEKISEKFTEFECMNIYEIFSESLSKLEANANLSLTVNALTAKIFNKQPK